MTSETPLINFYSKLLTSLGVTVDDEGYLFVGKDVNKVMVTVDGKPLVLPTRHHLSSLLDKNDKGEVSVVKVPYNPLNENVVRSISMSLMRTKVIAEGMINYYIAIAGELLLRMAESPALQKKTNLEINKFLASLNKANNPGIQKQVDEKSVVNWVKLFENSLNSDKPFTSIFLKKAKTHQNVKYIRTAVLGLPVYEMLKEATDKTPVFGMTLRNKELTVYKLIFEFLIEDITENDTVVIGSNDVESPASLSLLKLYTKVMKRLLLVIDMLRPVSKEVSDRADITLAITDEDLDTTGKFKSDLLGIPDEHEINRANIPSVSPATALQNVNRDIGSLPAQQQVYPQQQQQYTQAPQQSQQNLQPMRLEQPVSDDPVKRILARTGMPVAPVMVKGQAPQMNTAYPAQVQMQPQMTMHQPMQQPMQMPMRQQQYMYPQQQQMVMQPQMAQQPMVMQQPMQPQMMPLPGQPIMQQPMIPQQPMYAQPMQMPAQHMQPMYAQPQMQMTAPGFVR